jgi:hypothetical protein
MVLLIVILCPLIQQQHTGIMDKKVKNLTEMGFPEPAVRAALEAVGGDENLALEKLLG